MSNSIVPTFFKKPSGAVEISEPEGTLTLVDRRLWNHLLAHAYPNIGKSEVFSIRLVDVRAFAAEARKGSEDTDNRRLKDSIERLQRTTVKFNFLDSHRGEVWQSSQLLGTCEIATSTGELRYSYPLGLSERLIEPALYSYLSLKVIYQFESKYSLILYELLKRYADREASEPFCPVQTSQLRELLGTRDKLKNWQDLRKRAIDPALDEINALAGFTVEMTEVRQGGGRGGGKVVSVVFRVRRKELSEAEEAARQLEKPKAQRRGEKKAKAEDDQAARALLHLDSCDIETRTRWAKRAESLGVKVPAGGTARENLGKWVPAVAALIIEEEGLQ